MMGEKRMMSTSFQPSCSMALSMMSHRFHLVFSVFSTQPRNRYLQGGRERGPVGCWLLAKAQGTHAKASDQQEALSAGPSAQLRPSSCPE